MTKKNFASGDDDSFDEDVRYEVGEPSRRQTAVEVAALFTQEDGDELT